MGLSRAMWASVAVVAVLASAVAGGAQQLSPEYYNATCPSLSSIVRNGMAQAVQKEPRMGASILRLFFHDCFVQGCDASVLLDDVPGNFTGEKNAAPNANSLRGFEVIDTIKAQVEASCKATVSCADILALAARDAVNLLGGPTWRVPLGRRDARTTNPGLAESNLPPPFASLSTLLSRFSNKSLDARDLTALSGAHTVGQARCANFRRHIYDEPAGAVNQTYAAELKARVCPPKGNDSSLAPMEPQAPDAFDNGYFRDLLARRVLLGSDQALYGSNGTTDRLVRAYAANATLFLNDFATAMVKLGNLSPPTGTRGEVRLNCRRVN